MIQLNSTVFWRAAFLLSATFGINILLAQTNIYYSFKDSTSKTEVLFFDNYTGDTVYCSNSSSGSFTINNHLLVLLRINQSLKLVHEILVEGKDIRFTIDLRSQTGYANLYFEQPGINAKYHQCQNELTDIKIQIDSLVTLLFDKHTPDAAKTEIKKGITHQRNIVQSKQIKYFTENPSAFLTLNFINSQLPALPLERKKLIAMLGRLDIKTKTSSTYAKIKQRLSDTITYDEYKSTIPNLVLEDTTGQTTQLLSLIKPGIQTYVVFWASWCYGCHTLLTKIESLAKIKDKPLVQFVFISFDTDRKLWLKALSSNPVLKNSYLMAEGFDDLEIYRLGFNYLPYVIQLNSEGIITKKGFEF